MKYFLIAALPLSVLAADNNTNSAPDVEIRRQFEFPMMVQSAGSLAALKAEYPEYCPQAVCSGRQRGEYLLLDWSGKPEWRAIHEFEFADFSGNFSDIGYGIAYLDAQDGAATRNARGRFSKYGMLFHRLQLPTVTPGHIELIHPPFKGEAFVFNGITYQFKFSLTCARTYSSDGAIGYLGDINTTFVADGVEQDLHTSILTRDPSGNVPSCEEAKAEVAPYLIFDMVGDIDGDGKLDLLLLGNGGGIFPTLYLSSQAKAGELVKEYSINLSC